MGTPPASDAETLRRMRRQRRRDTRAELVVRTLLHRMGRRFRLGNRDLPGSPDAANRTAKWAVFVHGCYWHQHPGCPRATLPKRNRKFWEEKFRANRLRDERVEARLREAGFTVVVIWECQVNDLASLEGRLAMVLPD